MKTYLAIAASLILLLSSCSNSNPKDTVTEVKGIVTTTNSDRFQLYKTQNMWTFLKLDTSTGQIWQVQFSTEGDEYRFETPLSLTVINKSNINGRFVLYPTDNIYNFVMLDCIDGDSYQVQWSSEKENRFVIPIN